MPTKTKPEQTKPVKKNKCEGKPALVLETKDKVDYFIAEYCCEKHATEGKKKGQHVVPA